MKDRLASIRLEHDKLVEKLSSTSLKDSERGVLQSKISKLSSILDCAMAVETIEKSILETSDQMKGLKDESLFDLFKEELDSLEANLKEERDNLNVFLYPPDPLDKKSVFLEVRAGAGGQEAALFAADLVRMYTNYALNKKWKAEVSLCKTDIGGIREAVLYIQGKDVNGYLKYESGVHRVQRVPQTESSGRIHTSTATVAVLPDVGDDSNIEIDPADLRMDFYRASGAGGQHVNKTDSAVRITHIPTGVVVACQDERSQHKNKARAMKILRARLVAAQKEKHESEVSKKRQEMIGGGKRSEKVRTYNFPQNRVTDHRLGLTLKKLDIVIKGELDELIDALRKMDKNQEEV